MKEVMKINNLILSVTELEANDNVSNDMKPFQILKQYLTNSISYSSAMKELKKYDSGAYTNLVYGLINKLLQCFQADYVCFLHSLNIL